LDLKALFLGMRGAFYPLQTEEQYRRLDLSNQAWDFLVGVREHLEPLKSAAPHF
jgi:hypothetical protein